MQYRFTFFTAVVVMTIASLAFAQDAGQRAGDAVDKTGDQVDRAADRTADAIRGTPAAAPDAEAIRDVLAQVAEAGTTKDGLDDLVERFVDADRNRLGAGDTLDKGNEQLNGIIDQFRKNWQAKYNQEFDISDEDAVFNDSFVRIFQGEIGEPRLAGEREPGTVPPPANDPDRDKVAGGDTNRDPGRNIATVVVVESHGMPALNVPLIHEMPDSWKVDVGDTLTADQLRANVAKVLTKCNDAKDQWPADVNEAYRAVSHKVLLACMNKEGMGYDKTMPGHGMPERTQPGQPSTPNQPR